MLGDVRFRLMTINTQTIWREENDPIAIPARLLLQRFGKKVLNIYDNSLVAKCDSWICIAGLVPGFLTPIASSLTPIESSSPFPAIRPRDIERRFAYARGGEEHVHLLKEDEIRLVAEQTRSGDQVLRVSLTKPGECYGALFLHCRMPHRLQAEDIKLMEDNA